MTETTVSFEKDQCVMTLREKSAKIRVIFLNQGENGDTAKSIRVLMTFAQQ